MIRPVFCSLEEWDSILNYYRPNGMSKTWYLKEEGKLDFPKMWGIWNLVNTENENELFDEDTFVSQVTPPYNTDLVKFLTEKQITKDNISHLYLIHVFDPNFFRRNRNIGFKCISEKYIQDVRDNKCNIVLIHGLEGYSGSLNNDDLEIIDSWIKELGLSQKNIHYISGNLLIDKIAQEKNLEFNCYPLSFFDSWINYEKLPEQILSFKPQDTNNLFLSYNRNPREHKIFLLSLLLEKDMLSKGLISLGEFDVPFPERAKPSVNLLSDLAPFIIDKPMNINWANDVTYNDFERTFISLVTESLVLDTCLFLSEKIWKPISLGHPFITFGNYKTLEYLHSLGYRTFDKWIDESYDNEIDSYKRGSMIADEIEKFKNKTLEELQEIRKEMNEVCEHNFNLFRKVTKEKYAHSNGYMDVLQPLIKIFIDIRDKNFYKEKKLI